MKSLIDRWFWNWIGRNYVRPQLWKTDWTKSDEVALEQFLTSATGCKLQRLLVGNAQQSDAQAVQRATPWACGFACGVRALAAQMMALSAHVRPRHDEPGKGLAQPEAPLTDKW